MSNGDDTTTTAPAGPLTRDVATGADHVVKVKPFRVCAVACPKKWDPSSKTQNTLPVRYEIHNPSGRAISGRILYRVPGLADAEPNSYEAQPLTVHIQPLTRAQITQGEHKLPKNQEWDATITRGLKDRIGQKVTGDLSPIGVMVEIWNTDSPKPGRPTWKGPGTGRTIRVDVREYLSRNGVLVAIDCFAKVKWDRDQVIPSADPDQPNDGHARMQIEVRNVRDGTTVRLWVRRINDVGKPGLDEHYAKTGEDTFELNVGYQAGLQGAVVRGGKVVREEKGKTSSEKGGLPWVDFSKYDKHWKVPGKNYYAFGVALGPRGRGPQVYSERNYRDKKKNKQCLHLLYTVFIHRPSNDLKLYTAAANQLYSLFKSSRDYRPFRLNGGPRTTNYWVDRFVNRYMVIFLGHASCGCYHKDHPTYKTKPLSKEFKAGDRMDMFHRAFAPDKNVCPRERERTKAAAKAIKADEKEYKVTFGGCGNKSHVQHDCCLDKAPGTGTERYFVNYADKGDLRRTHLYLWMSPGKTKEGQKPRADDSKWVDMREGAPRFCFFSGGCRTILTTNMGEYFVKNNTRYYMGWVYSPWCDYGTFSYQVFNKYLNGTKGDRPVDPETKERLEDVVSRFLPVYRREAARGQRPRDNPRIMDSSGVLNPRNAGLATAAAHQ